MYMLKKMSNTSAVYQCDIKSSCPNLANSTKFVFDEADSTCASVFASLLAIFGTGLEDKNIYHNKLSSSGPGPGPRSGPEGPKTKDKDLDSG